MFIETWGDYLLGIVAFHRHELGEACRHFGRVVKNKYAANHRAAIDSMVGMALSFALLGRPDQVDRIIRLAHDYARWTGDKRYGRRLDERL